MSTQVTNQPAVPVPAPPAQSWLTPALVTGAGILGTRISGEPGAHLGTGPARLAGRGRAESLLVSGPRQCLGRL